MDPPLVRSRASRWILGVALAGYAFLELRVFLADGLPLFFDAHSHLTRAWLAERALAAGSYPTWSFEWYGGYRLFEFYAPAWYLLCAALAGVLGDVSIATKLLLVAGQLLCVLAMYALLLRLQVGALPALFAALITLHDPQRWRVLAVIGNHPTLLVYALTPLLMLCVVRADATLRGGIRAVSLGALLLSAMALGHLTNSLAVAPALGVFSGVWILQRCSRPELGRALAGLAACGLAVCLLTAGFTIPMLRGLDLVSLSLDVGRVGFDLEPVAIVLRLAPESLRRIFVVQAGAPWLALAFVGAVLALRARHARWRAFAAGCCASLISLAFLGERAANGTIFFVAPLGAAALAIATQQLAPRARAAALALQILAVAAVPLWQRTQDLAPLRMVDAQELAIYTRIPETPGRGRTLDVTPVSDSIDGVYGQSSFSPYFSGRAIPFGGFPQGAPLAINLQLALLGRLVSQLAEPQPQLSADSLDLLALLQVEWLVDRSPDPDLARIALSSADAERSEPGLLRLRHAPPALFAGELELLPSTPAGDMSGVAALLAQLQAQWGSAPLDVRGQRSLDALSRVGSRADWPLLLPLLQRMRIERAQTRAERFLVDPGLPAAPPDRPVDARFEVLSHREQRLAVELQALASAAGFVRLAYSYDPALRVALDGNAVPFTRDFLGGIVLAMPAGSHAIRLEAPAATLRLWLLGISAGTALLLAIVSLLCRLPGATHPTRVETS